MSSALSMVLVTGTRLSCSPRLAVGGEERGRRQQGRRVVTACRALLVALLALALAGLAAPPAVPAQSLPVPAKGLRSYAVEHLLAEPGIPASAASTDDSRIARNGSSSHGRGCA